MLRGAKELVKMPAARGNWQAFILYMLWTEVADGSLGCDSDQWLDIISHLINAVQE